jgi:hypothetical protein
MQWPERDQIVIHELAIVPGARKVRAVQLLGQESRPNFTQEADGLHVTLPKPAADHMPYVLRIAFE